MKKTLTIITGWAHKTSVMKPLTRLLSKQFDITLNAPGEWQTDAIMGSYILGWSMGGMLALETASLLPKSIRGLILVNSTAKFCSGSGYSAGIPEKELRVLSVLLRRNPEKALSRFIQNAAAPAVLERRIRQRRVEEALDIGLDRLQAELAYLKKTDLRQMLHSIQTTSLILHGTEDEFIPCEAGQYLSRQLAYSTFKPCSGMGHDLPLRQPEWIAKQIIDFVS